jgi:hypothetical protein
LEGQRELIGPLCDFFVQGLVQPRAYISWQLKRLGAAKNFDCPLRLIDNHRAVFTMLKMALEIQLEYPIEVAVEVIGQLTDNTFTFQFGSPLRK